MTVADLAQRLNVKESTVRTYRWRGYLPVARYVGRTPVWSASEIEEWIRQRHTEAREGRPPRVGRE